MHLDQSILEISVWFLIQVKAEDLYFLKSKVFYPLKSFLPPFTNTDEMWNIGHIHLKIENLEWPEGGKKLLKG